MSWITDLLREPHRVILLVESASQSHALFDATHALRGLIHKVDPSGTRSFFVVNKTGEFLDASPLPEEVALTLFQNRFVESEGERPQCYEKTFYLSLLSSKERIIAQKGGTFMEYVARIESRDLSLCTKMRFEAKILKQFGFHSLQKKLQSVTWDLSWKILLPAVRTAILRAQSDLNRKIHDLEQFPRDSHAIRASATKFLTLWVESIRTTGNGCAASDPQNTGQTLKEEKEQNFAGMKPFEAHNKI